MNRNLANNNLQSDFLSTVNWRALQLLDVHNNSLTGPLTALRVCSQLQVLNAAQNSLSGSLSFLSNLPLLQILVLYDNAFTGGVPTAVFTLPVLQAAFLASNPLNSTLPVPFISSSPLQQLDLSNCSLYGLVPTAMSQLTNLTYLSLADNDFSGSIPIELSAMVFRSGGPWTGQLVLTGGQAGALSVLLLSNNRLNGTIPTGLLAPVYSYNGGGCTASGASSLTVLDLSNNELTGTLPVRGLLTTDNCARVDYAERNLVELIVSNNRLTGELPSDILLPPLSVLALANNSFSGPLSLPAPGFSSLRLIDVSGNNFSGVIPAAYGQIPVLTSLIASNNALLYVNCSSTNASVYDTQCLPAQFMTVNPQLQQSFDDGLVCNSVTAVRSGLSIEVDQRSYLRGVQCFCNSSTYQVPRSTVEWQGAPLCASCGSSGWCQCAGDSYAMTGCWAAGPSPNDMASNASAWLALECPYIASPSITACQLPLNAVCVPGNTTCQCATGYSNRRCSQCVDNYFASSRRCELCWHGLRVLLPVGWALALLVYVVYLLLVPGNASGVLKVTTFYGQSLLLLSENARVPWPPAIASLLHSSSETGSLSATALECVARGIDVCTRYIVYTMTPVGLVLVCVAVFVVGRLRRWQSAYDVLIYMVLSMLFITYFSVTLKALAGVSCTLNDGYLNAYPWIQCDVQSSAEFRVVLALSVVCLLVYTVGVPSLAGYHLFRKRTQLEDESVARRLGFLFGSYRPSTYWWEYVVTLRRLLLAVAITIVPFTQQQLSSAIIMTVLVVSIALQHTLSPFATVLENRLEQLSLYVLLLAFLGTYVVETAGAAQSVALQWLPVLLIVMVTLTGTVLVAATALVLLVRLVPKLALTGVGSRFVERSMTMVSLVIKADALRERLLQPQEEDTAAVDNDGL